MFFKCFKCLDPKPDECYVFFSLNFILFSFIDNYYKNFQLFICFCFSLQQKIQKEEKKEAQTQTLFF